MEFTSLPLYALAIKGYCQRDCRVSRLNLATFVINAETFDVPLVQVV